MTFCLQTHEDTEKLLALTVSPTEDGVVSAARKAGVWSRGSGRDRQGIREGPVTLLWALYFQWLGSPSSAQPWLQLGIHKWIHAHPCPCGHPVSEPINAHCDHLPVTLETSISSRSQLRLPSWPRLRSCIIYLAIHSTQILPCTSWVQSRTFENSLKFPSH